MVLEAHTWTVKALSEVVHLLKKLERTKIADSWSVKCLISFFCSRVNWGVSRGTLKIDINHEESYLPLIEMEGKRAVSRATISLLITQVTWIIIYKLHFM